MVIMCTCACNLCTRTHVRDSVSILSHKLVRNETISMLNASVPTPDLDLEFPIFYTELTQKHLGIHNHI